MAETPHTFSSEGARRIVDAVRKVERAQSKGRQPDAFDSWPDAGFATWFKVTASTSAGDNKWSYTLSQVYKSAAGYQGWTVVSEGMIGVTGYNSCEDMNDAAGQQGNGIDIDGADFPAGFDIKAVPTNSIVWGRVVYLAAGTTEVWFSFVNAVDGTCT